MQAPTPLLERIAAGPQRLLSLCLLTPYLMPALAVAAGEARPAPFAAPTQFTPTGAGSGTLRVVLALLLVLAAVFAAGWLMRRLRVLSGTGSPGLEVLSQASLGARERAVLLRVGQQQLLLGVAAGSVRLLYQLPAPGGESAPVTGDNAVVAPGAPPNGAPPRPNFRELLKRSLGR